jgi:Dolichyl-phosphate-mannose-protein mannosyltransferase
MLMPASGPRLAFIVRRHWALFAVLGVAAVLRVATEIAYRPALLFSDSWAYLGAAYSGSPVGILPDKPAGYSAILDLLGVPGRSLAVISIAQHVAGLATGVLMYLLLVRLGTGRLLAAIATAIVVLDAYLIALEQYVLAESFFVLAIVASAWLITRTRDPVRVALACALLAAAVLIRVPALIVVPVWLAYLVWSGVGWRAFAAGCIAVAVPLLAYAALHESRTGTFGFTQFDGWLLYGRTADLVDCKRMDIPRRVRNLCPTNADRRLEGRDPNVFYLWDPRSPARRLFGEPETRAEKLRSNARLREFGMAVVRARPFDYVERVTSDYVRFFEPGAMSLVRSYDDPITLPDEPRPTGGGTVRRRYFPEYTMSVHPPADALATYQRLVHTPRWLMGAFGLVGLLVLLLGVFPAWRERLPRRREVFLLVGGGLAMLLPAAMNHFELRYLIPSVPLLVCGGVLGLLDLARALRGAHEPSGSPASERTGVRRSAAPA